MWQILAEKLGHFTMYQPVPKLIGGGGGESLPYSCGTLDCIDKDSYAERSRAKNILGHV